MSKILIVSGNLRDWSKNSGGKERTATLAEALHNHDVTFFSFAWGQESMNIKLHNGIHQIQVGLDNRTLRKYKELIRGKAKANHDTAVELLKGDLAPVIKKIKQLASNSDLVILDHFSVSPLIESITDVPIIYNSHNAEIVMANQLYPENTEIISIVEKMERIAIKNSIATTYCSTEDIVKLEDYYGKINNSFYVPNGSLMHEKVDPIKRLRSKNILFVGSSHMPNIIAAKKIIDIARGMPDYNFLICGNAGYSLQYEEQPKNFKIMGHVDDSILDKLFKESFAFINPMESGSGTHLKMMKALSYGIPIITSQVGARGFSKQEIDECMLIAETNKEFVASIKTLENNLYILNYLITHIHIVKHMIGKK
jgi:glycosyltransferase involved in cell wall biosynthesis